MRVGAIISAIAHAGVVTLVLLGAPKPFETAVGEAVAVDLVTSDEAPPEPDKPPKPEREREREPEVRPPLLLIPPRPTTVTTLTHPPDFQSAPSKASPAPAKSGTPKSQGEHSPQAQPEPQRSAAAPASPPPAASLPEPQDPVPSIFAPASIPKLMEITPPPPPATVATIGFDAVAESTVNLAREDVVAFKAHLRKCLRLPAGVDAERNLRVVMRVFLQRDGALAAAPMLVSAPAAREGPALVQAATSALKACQPYVLPADKYDEWKMLDLTLSPRDMTGG